MELSEHHQYPSYHCASQSLTIDDQVYLLGSPSADIVSHADVDAGVVAVQRDDLQRAVRHQPVAARVTVDLLGDELFRKTLNNA